MRLLEFLLILFCFAGFFCVIRQSIVCGIFLAVVIFLSVLREI